MSNQLAELQTDDPALLARHHIDIVGWAVLHIFPGPGTRFHHGFSYTVGLEETFEHPEVLIVNRTPPLAHNILNVVGMQVRAGLRFDDWSMSEQILKDAPVWFRACDPVNSVASIHAAFDQHRDTRALHLLLPDANGLFPWDPGAESSFASQPHGMRYLTTGFAS